MDHNRFLNYHLKLLIQTKPVTLKYSNKKKSKMIPRTKLNI
ncbi:hypothetical protein T4C_1941 [Trichinella pseudospiralis]|uniref:Uncharacterized protein n=1 Tax=Trichinella pseudospiralis TaxID=6337 RepID=A0A0V1HG93_TRIPS|nr:hypothetical protein T4C_1941 [Trichinella pseudospiralis]